MDSHRVLIRAGALTAPVFYGIFLVLALATPGFHLERHSISALSLADLGWVQRLNFVVSGVLALAGALGLARAWRGQRAGVAAPGLVAVLGLGLVVSGVFSTDPAMGFPPGAPEGLPAVFSTSARVHGLGFAVAFTALTGAAFAVARRCFGEGRRGRGLVSLVVGVATPLGIVAGMTVLSGVAGLVFAAAGLLSLGWLSWVFLWSSSTRISAQGEERVVSSLP